MDHYDGLIFLDTAGANPRLSYQFIGFLEDTYKVQENQANFIGQR
jgi:hypothetical protein